MSEAPVQDSARGPAHPAPGRGQVRGLRLLIGLCGAPLAWVAQMSLSEPLSAQTCYPASHPLASPLWPSAHALLLVVSAVCLLAGCVATVVAWQAWRSTRHETTSNAADAMHSGSGRTRFLALMGVMTSAMFVAAIIFSALGATLMSACGSAR